MAILVITVEGEVEVWTAQGGAVGPTQPPLASQYIYLQPVSTRIVILHYEVCGL